MRVLAAEDNKTNRLVMQKLLKSLNIDLEFAENGQLAVDAWERMRPDLVLMDISMPIMDGKEATRAIRAKAAKSGLPHTPIIAVTAHAVEGDKEEILAAGLDHYLTKPLKKQAIFDRIRVAMPDNALPVFPDEDTDASVALAHTPPVREVTPPPPGTSDEGARASAGSPRTGITGERAQNGLDLANVAPSVLPQPKSEPQHRLSEALTADPVLRPNAQYSPVLGRAQDMWNSLAETEPKTMRADP